MTVSSMARLMGKMVGGITYDEVAQTKSFRWRETATSPMHEVCRRLSWDVGAARCCGFWRVSEF